VNAGAAPLDDALAEIERRRALATGTAVADTGQRALDVLSLMTLEDGRRWGETASGFQWANARAILEMASEVRQHWIELPRGARETTDLAGIQLARPVRPGPVGASDEERKPTASARR
jgi:hypothetical protein